VWAFPAGDLPLGAGYHAHFTLFPGLLNPDFFNWNAKSAKAADATNCKKNL
jgi:hypothetical protein